MNKTIKIIGYSGEDRSVGIISIPFEVDTGIPQLNSDEKEYIIKGIIRDIWELHDNGDLHYNFSDEIKEDDWDYTRIMNYQMSQEILNERKKGE